MSISQWVKRQLLVRRAFAVQFLSILVGVHGVYIIASSLVTQLGAHRGSHLNDLVVDVPLFIGLSLLYLGTLLRRRKRTAWLVAVTAYVFYLGLGINQLLRHLRLHNLNLDEAVRSLILPVAILILLFVLERAFIVKSDVQGFRFALRIVAAMLLVAVLYGTIGFTLLDQSDFHQEISFTSGLHYTVDQFNLTTTHPLHPYTKRAQLFDDSLSFVSFVAVIYAAFSLFQPLRGRLSDQRAGRERMTDLLTRYGAHSEEFFKLWPHDKQYFFDDSGQAGLAFHIYRGVALCLSDPVGDPMRFSGLLANFRRLCFSNDWLPAFIHVSDQHRKLYESNDFTLQKLGQDAVLDIGHFQSKVANEKYFRQIGNKFNKRGYSAELLSPPHHQAVLDRLRAISNDWLSKGGRVERGLVMGFYSDAYMQLCQVLVARDAAGTIQGFVNLVPAEFDREEANYDLLRHASGSLGNINDFMLMNLIVQLANMGYGKLNLGLCPLVGLDETDKEQRTMLDNVMRFAYANGDRFYSFSGLYRFKAKYEPEWHDRYLGYQGGVRGFSRTITAITRSMRKVI